MNASEIRTRVAVLWVSTAIAASCSLLLYLVVPGALNDMVVGEMEGEPLTDAIGYMFAALVAIPLAMATVTLLNGDRLTRYGNLIIATLLGLFAAFAVGSHLWAGDFNGHVLMAALACVLAFVTAGLSVTWLRSPVQDAAASSSNRASTTPAPSSDVAQPVPQ